MNKHFLLLIGPRNSKSIENVGGIVVLFEDLIAYCQKENIPIKIIDTNKVNHTSTVTAYFNILYSLIKFSKRANHISFHGTAKGFLVIAPFVVVVAKLFQKKVSLRKFAGSFYEIFTKSGLLKKYIYKYVLRNADFLFFETKFLVEKFKCINSNVYWWPNSRTIKNRSFIEKSFSNKFVFISQIKRSKGIFEFIESSDDFDNTFIFEIYGPIMDDEFEIKIKNHPNIQYKGVLNPNDISKTLLNFDVLVLPTYHEGEGYPGIIIEAFGFGIPVITTDWNSITEIVQHGFNGSISTIKNSIELSLAIKSFNIDNYPTFSKNAYASFENYNSEIIYSKFFNQINNH